MFPIHCIVEAVKPTDCLECNAEDEAGQTIVDSYAIVAGHTPLSQLVETVLNALGLQHLARASKGKIHVKNWKSLNFTDVTDNLENTIDYLLRDISSNITLRIVVKHQTDVANDQTSFEMKDRLLKALLFQQPGLLQSFSDPQLRRFVESMIRADDVPLANSADVLAKFNDWCDARIDQPKRLALPGPSPAKAPAASGDLSISPQPSSSLVNHAATKFNSLLELPKLDRWFRDNPNPSRTKLLEYMHILNRSNYRKHSSKISYQQICNWFSNARAVQRKVHPAAPFAAARTAVADGAAAAAQYKQFMQLLSAAAVASSAAAATVPEAPAAHQQLMMQSLAAHLNAVDAAGGGNAAGDDDLLLADDGGNTSNDEEASEPKKSIIKLEETTNGDGHVSPASTNQQSPSPGGSSSGKGSEKLLNGSAASFLAGLSMVKAAESRAAAAFPNLEHFLQQQQGDGSEGGGEGGNQDDAMYRARSRLMFDPLTEVPMLERWFEENPHPSWLMIDQYTEMLNTMPYRQTYPPVTPHNVKIWFKNRRAKSKRLTAAAGGTPADGVMMDESQ